MKKIINKYWFKEIILILGLILFVVSGIGFLYSLSTPVPYELRGDIYDKSMLDAGMMIYCLNGMLASFFLSLFVVDWMAPISWLKD